MIRPRVRGCTDALSHIFILGQFASANKRVFNFSLLPRIVSLYHQCIVAGQNPVRPFCLTPFSQELIVWRLTYTRAARSSCDIPAAVRRSRMRAPISMPFLSHRLGAAPTGQTMPHRDASYHQWFPTSGPSGRESPVKSSLHAPELGKHSDLQRLRDLGRTLQLRSQYAPSTVLALDCRAESPTRERAKT